MAFNKNFHLCHPTFSLIQDDTFYRERACSKVFHTSRVSLNLLCRSRRNLHPRVKVDQAGRPLPPKKT